MGLEVSSRKKFGHYKLYFKRYRKKLLKKVLHGSQFINKLQIVIRVFHEGTMLRISEQGTTLMLVNVIY